MKKKFVGIFGAKVANTMQKANSTQNRLATIALVTLLMSTLINQYYIRRRKMAEKSKTTEQILMEEAEQIAAVTKAQQDFANSIFNYYNSLRIAGFNADQAYTMAFEYQSRLFDTYFGRSEE